MRTFGWISVTSSSPLFSSSLKDIVGYIDFISSWESMRDCFGGDAFLFLAVVGDDAEDVAGKRSTGVLFSYLYAAEVVEESLSLSPSESA